MSNSPLTPEKDAEIFALHGLGLSARVIADRTGVNVKSVAPAIKRYVASGYQTKAGHVPSAAERLVRENRSPKLRRCLLCGEDFFSSHASNRICGKQRCIKQRKMNSATAFTHPLSLEEKR